MNVIKSLINRAGFSLILYYVVLFAILFDDQVYLKCIWCLFVIYKCGRLFDRNCLWFLLFSFSYTSLLYYNGLSPSNFESLTYLLCPCVFYLFGKNISSLFNERTITVFWLNSIFCATIVLVFSNIMDALVTGIVNTTRVVLIDEDLTRGATIQGIVAAIGLSGVSYLFSYKFEHKFITCLYFFVFSSSLFCVIHLVNRTGLYVSILTMIVVYLYMSRKGLTSIIFPILFLWIIFYVLVEYNFIDQDIISAYDSRESDVDYSSSTAGKRTIIWDKNISRIWEYPFGWRSEILSSGYAHNLWIDVARETGLIPFGLLVFITVYFIRRTKALIEYPVEKFNGFLIGTISCFLIQSFVEPIIEAQANFFYLLCLLWGIQEMLLLKNKKY